MLTERIQGVNTASNQWINNLILILLAVSILVSDWMVGLIAMSEIFIGLILVLIAFKNFDYVKSLNYKFMSAVLIFFIIQFTYNLSVDMTFIFTRALYNVIKIFFYLTFINLLFNYIQQNKLEKQVLVMLNVTAIIALIIGIYITVSILFFDQLPYEFMWHFTRSDLHSYRFRGPGFIVRTRSIFSEPAHLGYFLNMVIGVNIFSKLKKSVPIWVTLTLIAGVILTLSYASIGVLGLMLLIKGLTLKNKMEMVRNNWILLLVSLLFVGIVIFIFRENLYQTIIVRTSDILSGGDNSAFVRVINSWLYVTRETVLMGRGLGHTPPLQNIYAYFLSDMGIFSFLFSLIFTAFIVKNNVGLGLTFILLNFQKGGYLSPIFPILVLIFLTYSLNFKTKLSFKNRKEQI
ncbi:hypothetical protein [Alkalibacterium pelagium]|uniref:O-antigen ligase like membrane protein n=1 Tax=Alkalibacterium pelagium TaxID=426702 RepID=A0A1H7NN90_9LACT|nr:hypothetical protein [Alkalibacterium pelagium]GEN51438.1 hypothetical protein APE02nite_21030 [Alkalibacterium pelagium]SEL24427.1 hypothetical protein SAMN04488099_11530 [Alkalibacterium pelagium]